MQGSGAAEIIFIAAMMAVILIICFVAVFFFFKTYRKEMAEKKERLEAKKSVSADAGTARSDETNGAS